MLSDFSKPLHRWPTSPGEFLIGGKIVEGIIDAEVKIDALDSHKIEAPIEAPRIVFKSKSGEELFRVDDGPAKQLFCGLLELYGSDAPSAFAMIYQIAEVSHNPEIGLEATIEAAAELLEARDITGAFDLLGITKNPSVMYKETYPITETQKRITELKEIRKTYIAVVEQT